MRRIALLALSLAPLSASLSHGEFAYRNPQNKVNMFNSEKGSKQNDDDWIACPIYANGEQFTEFRAWMNKNTFTWELGDWTQHDWPHKQFSSQGDTNSGTYRISNYLITCSRIAEYPGCSCNHMIPERITKFQTTMDGVNKLTVPVQPTDPMFGVRCRPDQPTDGPYDLSLNIKTDDEPERVQCQANSNGGAEFDIWIEPSSVTSNQYTLSIKFREGDVKKFTGREWIDSSEHGEITSVQMYPQADVQRIDVTPITSILLVATEKAVYANMLHKADIAFKEMISKARELASEEAIQALGFPRNDEKERIADLLDVDYKNKMEALFHGAYYVRSQALRKFLAKGEDAAESDNSDAAAGFSTR